MLRRQRKSLREIRRTRYVHTVAQLGGIERLQRTGNCANLEGSERLRTFSLEADRSRNVGVWKQRRTNDVRASLVCNLLEVIE